MEYRDIAEQVRQSDSYNVLKTVIGAMKGKTFHHGYHILYDLRTLLGGEPKTYLEIGSYCGASACLMLQHQLPTRVICIDPLNLPAAHFGATESQGDVLRYNINRFNKFTREVAIYRNHSTDPDLHEKLKGEKVDILFIDGDHAGNVVINDFVYFHQMVNPGGFIVFDDYLDVVGCPQVRPAVDHICAKIKEHDLPFDQIGLIRNYQNAEPVEFDMLNEFILGRR
jgi:predicted O-methyltransferase YrrM